MNVQGEPRRHWEVARKNLWKQLRQQQLNLLRLGEVKIVLIVAIVQFCLDWTYTQRT